MNPYEIVSPLDMMRAKQLLERFNEDLAGLRANNPTQQKAIAYMEGCIVRLNDAIQNNPQFIQRFIS